MTAVVDTYHPAKGVAPAQPVEVAVPQNMSLRGNDASEVSPNTYRNAA